MDGRRPGRDPQPIAAPTRAEVARRRLAQLDASFLASADPPVPEVDRAPDDVPDAGEPAARASAGRTRGHRAVATARPRLPAVHVRVVATLAVAAGVVLTWWLLAERPQTSPSALDLATPAAEPSPTASGGPSGSPPSGELVVDVAGKVKRPGIVVLPAGSRVHEAIEAAGGLRGDVDTSALNLARVLGDGEQVLVGAAAAPAPGGVGSGGGGGAGAGDAGSGPAGAPVNLNTATVEQLDTLPGVGPVTAESIVTWRTENGPFAAVEDLLEVSGIGDKTLADLRDLVSVG